MKLLKKWILPGAFALLALLAIIFIAAASAKSTNHGITVIAKTIVFGCKENVMSDGTTTIVQSVDYGPCVLPLIGWILILLGLICGALVAFLGGKLFKGNKKLIMILLIAAASLVLIGGIFQFFVIRSLANVIAKESGIDAKQVYDQIKDQGVSAPLCILGGVFSIIGALSLGVVPFLPEKK